MDSDAEAVDERNDFLSESYKQGVSRVAQRSNDAGFNFELPREVVEKREKVWDNLFDKYADEASDDIELNIETMEPVATEEDDEGEEDDDGAEYYSKCRAPMRKLPASIQYWIDTGNPPYQFIDNEDHSETGSSLSEGEHSRTGHSEILRGSTKEDGPKDHSPYSSVDTAAYILSNTNVTKKAETIAIVEGAKKPDFPRFGRKAPENDEVQRSGYSANIGNKSLTLSSTENAPRNISAFNRTPKKAIIPTPKKVDSLKADRRSDGFLGSGSRSQLRSSPSQQSVKLSEILPTFEQFDEILHESEARILAASNSAATAVRSRLFDEDPEVSQSSLSSSCFPNLLKRPVNRRKLYTGRNSPVDLVLEKTRVEDRLSLQPKIGNYYHPALESDSDERRASQVSRPRARRKRKRASRAAENVSQNDTSQESLTPFAGENSKGDMRYTDFFESLGLTPSKTIIGNTPVGKPPRKRSRKTEKASKETRNPRKKLKLSNGNDSPIKETGATLQSTEDSGLPSEKRQSTTAVLGDKILALRIERLSEGLLARYQRPDIAEKDLNKRKSTIDRQTYTGSSDSSSSNKKSKASDVENIELLTAAAHDSDSSTILICACNNDNNGQCSDSDDSLFTRNPAPMNQKSLLLDKAGSSKSLNENKLHVGSRAKESREKLQVPAAAEGIEKSCKTKDKPIIAKSTKLPNLSVRLEKLEFIDSRRAMKTSESARNKRESNGMSEEKNIKLSSRNSLIKKSPARVESSPDSLESSSSSHTSEKTKNGCVTFSSLVVNGRPSKLRPLRSTMARCSLGISIPSDEEEDSFVKLVNDFGSPGRTRKDGRDGAKTDSGEKTANVPNGNEKVTRTQTRTRFCSNMGMLVSSDEGEEDTLTKKIQQSPSKRRMNRNNTNIDRVNDIDLQKKKMFSKNCTEACVNQEVTPTNRSDESNYTKLSDADKTKENWKDEATSENRAKRSTRLRKPPTWEGFTDRLPSNSSSAPKVRSRRNIFGEEQESSSSDGVAEVFAPPDDFQPELKGVKTRDGRQRDRDKSKKLILPKIGRSHSARFQTRLDVDFDSDTESRRLTFNSKNRRSKSQTDSSRITKIYRTEVSKKEKPIVESREQNRASPSRSSGSLYQRRKESTSQSGTRSSQDSFESSRKDSRLDQLPSTDARAKDADEKRTSSRSRNPSKSDGSKKSSKVSPHRKRSSPPQNRSSNQSPPIAKKKSRRTRLLGTPIEYESDDDDDDDKFRNNGDPNEKSRRKRLNGTIPKQLSDGDLSGQRNSSKKRDVSRNMFSNSMNDSVDIFNLTFGDDVKSRAQKCSVVIDSLKFVPANKHKNLNSLRQSTMSFRTKLRSESDDETTL